MKFQCFAVVFVFLSICVLHNAAVPYAEAGVQGLDGNYVQTEETQQTAAAAEETGPLVLTRTKRHHGLLALCRAIAAARAKAAAKAKTAGSKRDLLLDPQDGGIQA